MGIHDQSYRRYAGPRTEPGAAWSVIAWSGIRALLSRRLFLLVLLFAWSQFVVRAVVFYLSANFPSMELIAPSAQTFRDFFDQQDFFVFVVTVYAGAGLIANDRRANALQIYLAKPLTRAEYVAGKAGVLVVFLLLVTWAPAMLLLVLQTMFAGSLAFVRENVFLVPAMTVFALLEVLAATFAMLALSSLSTSARFAGMLYAGAILFTTAIFQTVRGVTGSSAASWISFSANLAQVGDVVFGVAPRHDTPWGISLLIVVGLIGVSLVVLRWRVRGVEVVT